MRERCHIHEVWASREMERFAVEKEEEAKKLPDLVVSACFTLELICVYFPRSFPWWRQ
jgi:hypothetical protein